MDLGPFPVSRIGALQFNRVGSYILENFALALQGRLELLIFLIPLLRNFPYLFTTIMVSDIETETCKQGESPGVNVNFQDPSKEDVRAGSSSRVLVFLPCVERKEAKEEQHMI